MKQSNIMEIKRQIERLTEWWYIKNDPRIQAAVKQVEAENAPKVEALRTQMTALQSKRKKTPRWPDNTPEDILKLCSDYWSGTAEHATYRIHLWNDKAVWTSYPAGGYSTVGGFTPTPPAYELISRTELAYKNSSKKVAKKLKGLCFERNSGKRVTPAMMQAELDKL